MTSANHISNGVIVDGRALASEVRARARERAAARPRAPRVLALVMNESPATQSYLAIKQKRAADAGCMLDIQRFPEDTDTATLVAAVRAADADAIIVQLPLPASVDTEQVCAAIPIEKDADVLSVAARARFDADEHGALVPPVVGAVAAILATNHVDPRGKRAVVIGAGWLVGRPCATWLARAGATVTHLSREGDMALLREADIIVSGAGSAHIITPDLIKEGVVLIDAGTSESDGTIAGDADPACAEKCSLFTPVPGGVGPLAVAMLFENVAVLTERAMKV